MTPSEGRVFFFGQLANELQTVFPGDLPPRIALRISPNNAALPAEDRICLAEAFCKLHIDDGRPVSIINMIDKDDEAFGKKVIFRAAGESLSNILSRIRSQTEPEVYVVMEYHSDGANSLAEVLFDVKNDVQLIRTAVDRLFHAAGHAPDSLASIRFSSRGFSALEEYELFRTGPRRDWTNPGRLERFCEAVTSGWFYQEEPVSGEDALTWVKQFRESGFEYEACQLLAYLRRDGFLSEGQVVSDILLGYDQVCRELGFEPTGMHLQAVGKSEAKLAYPLRKRFILDSLEQIIRRRRKGPLNLFCVDDFIGSGETMQTNLFDSSVNRHAPSLISLLRDGEAKVSILVSHADQTGIDRVCSDARAYGNVRILAAHLIDDRRRVFSKTSHILDENCNVGGFKRFCEEIGHEVYGKHPLGWGDRQWCLASEYTVPNCSLPILFGTGGPRQWKPLFPRQRQPRR